MLWRRSDFDNAAFPHDVTELWTVAPLAQLCQQTEDLNLSQLRDLFDGDSGIRTVRAPPARGELATGGAKALTAATPSPLRH